jgi:hypothetical protein
MKQSFVAKRIAMRLLTKYRTEWKNKNRLELDAMGAGSGGGRPL